MAENAAIAQGSSPAPAEEEPLCPLCDYNLRGLTTARCPECGAAFDWAEVRDPKRRVHPYLFEHHPERNFSSFIQTLKGGLRPVRFWTTLFPTQPSRPRRLLLYWLICILLACPSIALQLVLGGQLLNNVNQSERLRTLTNISRNPNYAPWLKQHFGSISNYLNSIAPVFPSSSFFKELCGLQSGYGWRLTREAWWIRDFQQFMLMCVWPVITVLTLMLLRATMRRAQVRRAHLWRVAIYCGDLAVWMGLIFLLRFAFESLGRIALGPLDDWLDSCLWMAAAIVLTYRLYIAIARYLRFRHALPTALAVQIIFGLMVWKLYLMALGY